MSVPAAVAALVSRRRGVAIGLAVVIVAAALLLLRAPGVRVERVTRRGDRRDAWSRAAAFGPSPV